MQSMVKSMTPLRADLVPCGVKTKGAGREAKTRTVDGKAAACGYEEGGDDD